MKFVAWVPLKLLWAEHFSAALIFISSYSSFLIKSKPSTFHVPALNRIATSIVANTTIFSVSTIVIITTTTVLGRWWFCLNFLTRLLVVLDC